MTTTYPLDLMHTATAILTKAALMTPDPIAAPDGLHTGGASFEDTMDRIEECSVAIDAALSDFPIGSHEWSILTNLHTLLNLLEADMIS